MAPAVVVTAQDAFGNTDVNYPGTVALSIGTNPAAVTLSGTTAQPVSFGVARFSDLTIDKVGRDYTLVATKGQVSRIGTARGGRWRTVEDGG